MVRNRKKEFLHILGPAIDLWRFKKALYTLQCSVICFVIMTGILIYIDQMFDLSIWIRLPLILIMVVILIITWVFSDNRKKDLTSLIKHLEKEREFKDSISTARELIAGSIKTDNPLISELQFKQTLKLYKGNFDLNLLKSKKLKYTSVLFFIIIFVSILPFFFNPLQSMYALGRILFPFLPIKTLASFDVNPGNTIIGMGENIKIEIKPYFFKEKLSPEIIICDRTGEIVKYGQLSLSADGKGFIWKKGEIFQPFSYRVKWRWKKSPWYKTTPVYFPAVKDHLLTVSYPEYTKQKPKHYKNFSRISVLKNSDLNLFLKTTDDVETVQMKGLSEKIQGNNDGGKSEYELESFKCVKRGSLEIQLKNKKGLANRKPYKYEIICLDDEMPKVNFPDFKKDVIYLQPVNEPLEIDVVASDDYGLKEAAFHEERLGYNEKVTQWNVLNKKNQRRLIKFIPEKRGLLPGDVLIYHATASDLCPEHAGQVTVSEWHYVRICSPDFEKEMEHSEKELSMKNDSGKKIRKTMTEEERIIRESFVWQARILKKLQEELKQRKQHGESHQKEQVAGSEKQSEPKCAENSSQKIPQGENLKPDSADQSQKQLGNGKKTMQRETASKGIKQCRNAGNKKTEATHCQNPGNNAKDGKQGKNGSGNSNTVAGSKKPVVKTDNNGSSSKNGNSQSGTGQFASKISKEQNGGKSGTAKYSAQNQPLNKLSHQQNNMSRNLERVRGYFEKIGQVEAYEKALEFSKNTFNDLNKDDLENGIESAKKTLRQLSELIRLSGGFGNGKGKCQRCGGYCKRGKCAHNGKRTTERPVEFGDRPATWVPKYSNIDDGLKIPEIDKKAFKKKKQKIVKTYNEIVIDEKNCPVEFRKQIIKYFDLLRKKERASQNSDLGNELN